jgi:hypothetical protein
VAFGAGRFSLDHRFGRSVKPSTAALSAAG